MASPTSPDDIHGIACPRCTDKAHKTCTGCKSIAYCSLECQEADWPLHKILCSKFKDFSDDQRPRDDMRRVVVFHPDEDSPRLMWAPVVSPDGYEVLASDSVAITDPNGDQVDCQDLRPMRLLTNDWTGKELPHPIHMLVDDHPVGNYTCENRAVPVATERMRRYLWLGPLIAYSSEYFPENDPDGGENEEEVVEIQDLTMRDYADIVAWLVHFPIDWRIVLGRRGKVDCVRISSDGDEQSGGKLSLQAIRVPRSHPIFNGNAPVLEVSKRVDMPLFVRACATSKRGAHLENTTVQHLHFDCSITSTFGPSGTKRGSWIVARADKEPLDCKVVEALTDFCRYHLMAYFQICKGLIELAKKIDLKELRWARTRVHRIRVLQEITPEKFSEYRLQWEAEKADAVATEASGLPSYTPEKAKAGLERMGLTKDDYYRIITLLSNRSG